MSFCKSALRTSRTQDLGAYMRFDVMQALVDFGNIYYGSSRPIEQVVREEVYYDATVVIDCDEGYYTGVFNPLIYQYFTNYNVPQVSTDHTYLPQFIAARFMPSISSLKHISDAPCCFRTFVSVVDHVFIENNTYLIHTVNNYGIDGYWSPCLKCVKPKF